jgi:hypothetical protein
MSIQYHKPVKPQQQHSNHLTNHYLQLKSPCHRSCFASCLFLPTAEGQNRLFGIISAAAETREAERAGVWSSFGQPYACLGVPQQVRTDRIGY